jgi:hypothetical protein
MVKRAARETTAMAMARTQKIQRQPAAAESCTKFRSVTPSQFLKIT